MKMAGICLPSVLRCSLFLIKLNHFGAGWLGSCLWSRWFRFLKLLKIQLASSGWDVDARGLRGVGQNKILGVSVNEAD